jgi:rhodanese-related sulfurtransferase
MKKSKDWILIIGLLGVIFVTGAGYLLSKKSEKKDHLEVASRTINQIENRKTVAPMTLLTTEEARALHQAGQVTFLDARPPREFQYAHIPRAISAHYVDAKANPQVLAMDRNAPVVAYCNSPKCPMAEVLATRLYELGFTKIYVYPGGMKEWIMAKLPVQEAELF